MDPTIYDALRGILNLTPEQTSQMQRRQAMDVARLGPQWDAEAKDWRESDRNRMRNAIYDKLAKIGTAPRAAKGAAEAADYTPLWGDASFGEDIYQDVQAGNYGRAGLTAAMAVPFMVLPGAKAAKNTLDDAAKKLGKNAFGDVDLMNVLRARAKMLDIKDTKKRPQPRANRARIIDEDYMVDEPALAAFADKDLHDAYPWHPDGLAPLKKFKGGRVVPFAERKDEIAHALVKRIRASGIIGSKAQKFYHSVGPIYRAARKHGLTHQEALDYVRDFAQNYGATSPRSKTFPNLLSTTLAMAKEAQGIPLTRVLGPGTVKESGEKGLSEKGYSMFLGPSGLHRKMLERVSKGETIDRFTNTKPFMFAENMAGNLSGVTVDTHAIRGAMIALNDIAPGSVPKQWFKSAKYYKAYQKNPDMRITPNMVADTLPTQQVKGVAMQTEYPIIADVYHRVGEILDVPPAEAQALSWFGLGDETGLASELKTVADIFDERIDVTSQVMGAPADVIAEKVFRREIPVLGLGAGGAVGLLNQQGQQDDGYR